MTRGVLFSSCDRKWISCDKKYSFFHWKISFCDTYMWHLLYDMAIFHVTEMLHHMRYIFCYRNDFYFAFHQKYFSCETKKFIFPVTQGELPVTGFVLPLAMNIHRIFPVTRTIFLVTEIRFLFKFGSSFRYITFSWLMHRIYNQNFVWDLVGAWFPGSPWLSHPGAAQACLFFFFFLPHSTPSWIFS